MYLVSRDEDTGKVSVRKKCEGMKGIKITISAMLEFILNILFKNKK